MKTSILNPISTQKLITALVYLANVVAYVYIAQL